MGRGTVPRPKLHPGLLEPELPPTDPRSMSVLALSAHRRPPGPSTLRHPQGRHLLVGGAPSRDQHHVEASEADDRDEEEASHTHDSHSGPLRPTAMGEDTERCLWTNYSPTACPGMATQPQGVLGRGLPGRHAPAHPTSVARPRIRDGGVGGSQPLGVVQHVDQAEGDDAHHVRAERQQEQEEVTVVAPPDAVVDPWTVVVKVLGKGRASGHAWARGRDAGRQGCVAAQGGHLDAAVADTAVGAARGAVEVAGGAPLHADLDAPHVHILVQRRPEVVLLVLILIRCGSRPERGQESDLPGRTSLPSVCQPTHQDAQPRLPRVSHSAVMPQRGALPRGKTPGSMKVAMLKLARTKRKMMPL